jgi:hypothetical protein
MTRYSRERSLGDLEKISNWRYFWAGNGSSNNTYPDYASVPDELRIISDVTGGRTNGRYPSGPVEHTVWKWQLGNQVSWVGDNGLTVIPLDMRPFGMVSDYQSLVLDNFTGSFWSQLNEEAFNSFSTQFPEKVSLSEFLFGLLKLKDLLPKLEQSISKTIASGFLTKKFGWDNLLSDLKNLANLVLPIIARLEFLRKSRGKPTRIGWYKANVLELARDDVFIEPTRSWGTRIVRTGYRVDVRATATLLQRLDHLDDTYGLLRAFAGALGLDNPLKVVWVNLPFSFVADWFLKISTHLDRLAKVKPAEEWIISDITRSRKETVTFNVYQENSSVVGGFVNENRLLGTATMHRYSRAVGLPIPLDVYSPSNLNPSQLALLVAMLA